MAAKFYWLKLEEDFFQTEEMEWLEEQENGKEYVLFYLKLCLKVLKNNGKLIRQVGKMTIEYTNQKLAELTNTDIEVVEKAMELFAQIGLIEVPKEGVAVVSRVVSMVETVSESKEAVRKRAYRNKKNGTELGQVSQTCPKKNGTELGQNVPQNIEYRDKSIEIRKDDYHHLHNDDDDKCHDEKSVTSHVEIFLLWEKNIMPLTPLVGEKLTTLIDEVGEAAVEYAISAAVEHGARNFSYVQTVARNYASGNTQKPAKEQMPF